MSFQRENYYNLTELKTRGWTLSKITLWLKEPDEIRKNPLYRTASPTKLYLKERVISLEGNKSFKDWLLKTKTSRDKLSASQKKVHEIKKEELFKYINGLEIKIEKFHKNQLYKFAVRHYNNLWDSRNKYDKYATVDASDDFLNRISLNMLRHENEHYELELNKMFGKTGNDDAYILLKNKINDEIFKIYPFLNQSNEQE